jgi:hypothetical protein
MSLVQFIIRTDPKNSDYEFVEGLRKKIETYTAEDSGTVEVYAPWQERFVFAERYSGGRERSTGDCRPYPQDGEGQD